MSVTASTFTCGAIARKFIALSALTAFTLAWQKDCPPEDGDLRRAAFATCYSGSNCVLCRGLGFQTRFKGFQGFTQNRMYQDVSEVHAIALFWAIRRKIAR